MSSITARTPLDALNFSAIRGLQPTRPVLVTSASGFIASHVVAQLLEKGYRARDTVRSLNKEKELAPLRSLPGPAEKLELVAADLLTEGAYDEAARGCEYILHTASPYMINAKDPQKHPKPRVEGDDSGDLMCEESIRLIEADGDKDAQQRAAGVGAQAQHEYLNDKGNAVRWRFRCVLEIQDLCESQIAHGMEVFSNMFHKSRP